MSTFIVCETYRALHSTRRVHRVPKKLESSAVASQHSCRNGPRVQACKKGRLDQREKANN